MLLREKPWRTSSDRTLASIVPAQAWNLYQKEITAQRDLQKIGIYINYVRPIIYNERKIWALGQKVFYDRPPNETFHEFIIWILQQTLGKEWWESQLLLPEEDRHFIIKCFFKFSEWQKKNATEENKVEGGGWSAIPDGWSTSLLALAFDISGLVHTLQLPDHLLNRLRNKNEYQGARYEIAIAAVFARLDCSIDFLDDTQLTTKHCEFIATHRPTGVAIAVEAKSRQRRGVLHQEGNQNVRELL